MKHAGRWLPLLGLLLLSGCGRTEWQDVDWKEARCRFKMPRGFGDYPEKDVTIPGVKAPLRGKTFEDKAGGLGVFYVELPPGEGQEDSVSARLGGAVAGLKASRKDAVFLDGKQQDHSADSPPWREAQIEWKDSAGVKMVTLMRVYLVERRLYVVMSSGTPNWVESKETQEFLRSFTTTR